MYNEFGKWLRTARKRRRLTQKELGRRIGYSDAIISIYENARPHSDTGGAVRPSEDFIEKVARELRIDEGQGRMLAGYKGDPAPVTLREVQQMLDETPQTAFAVSPSGKYALVPLELVQRLANVLNELNSHANESQDSN